VSDKKIAITEEIKGLEEIKSQNPNSSLLPAIEHRTEVLKKKLEEFTKSEQGKTGFKSGL